MEWIYRIIRRRTRPIPRYKAQSYVNKLSLAYYMIAWTGGGVALYSVLTQDQSGLPQELNVHAESNELQQGSVYSYANRVQTIKHKDVDPNVRILQFKNFTKVSDESYVPRDPANRTPAIVNREKADFFGEPVEDVKVLNDNEIYDVLK